MTKTRLLIVTMCVSLPTATALLVACTGDDDVVVPNGPDGAAVDSAVPDAATRDVVVADVVEEEAAFDGGFKPETYDTDLGAAACETLARCCFGDPHPDGGLDGGGTFNLTKCLSNYRLAGFDNSNKNLAKADASVVVVDQVKAAECVQAIRALECVPSAASYKSLRQKCFGALYGKGGIGAPCNYSIECSPGNFCKTALTDGGAADASATNGTCQPLRGADGACGDFTSDEYTADEACSYREDGQTGRYCLNVADFNTGKLLDPSQWKCQPARPTGADCDVSTWCASGMCDYGTNKCADSVALYTASCQYYVVK